MKFIITTYLIILALIMAGCGGVKKNTGREYILNNPLLDEQDRGFAIRLYDFLISDEAEVLREEISEDNIDADFLEADVYKKWGLGKKTDFTEHEKLYVIAISQGLIDPWRFYKNLDMHKIGAEDKKFLNELHLKYGKGPIDLRQELDESPETTDTFVYLAEILCGSRYVDDRSIVAIRDMLSGVDSMP